MVGRAWRELLTRLGATFEAPPSREINLASGAGLERISAGGFKTVINCAALTDVDASEADPARAMAVNGDGAGAVARACAAAGAALVHYSTDYVFDGKDRAPSGVGHVRCPVNAYGRSKARGEELIETSGGDWLIVRTSWVYAPWGNNFVRTLARALGERPEVRVRRDQTGRPTSAENLARVTLRLFDSGARGIWHVADDGVPCTRYDMAIEIAATLGGSARVLPDDGPAPARAPRPAHSVLDLSRTSGRLGPLEDWRTLLASVLRRLE